MSINQVAIYVDSDNGNDSGNGSAALPYQTIQGAIDASNIQDGRANVLRLIGDFALTEPLDFSTFLPTATAPVVIKSNDLNSRSAIDSGGVELLLPSDYDYITLAGCDFSNLPTSGTWLRADVDAGFINNLVDAGGNSLTILQFDDYSTIYGNAFENFTSPSRAFHIDTRASFARNLVRPGAHGAINTYIFSSSHSPNKVTQNIFDCSECQGGHRIFNNPLSGFSATENIFIGNRSVNGNSYFFMGASATTAVHNWSLIGNYFESARAPIFLNNANSSVGNYVGNSLYDCEFEVDSTSEPPGVLADNEILDRSLLGANYRLKRPVRPWPSHLPGYPGVRFYRPKHNPLRGPK